MKLPSFLKAILLFALLLISVYILFGRGLIDNVQLFNPGYRLSFVQECAKGFELSHQHLLAYRDNITPNYYPVENLGDDMGIYYFVPLVQQIFHTYTYKAYLIVFCGIALLGYSLATTGIGLLFEDTRVKFFSYFYLALIDLVSLFILDVYILAYLVTSLIPLLYWMWRKYKAGHIKMLYLILALMGTGLLAGIANQFRVYSGVGIIIVVIAFILFERDIPLFRKFFFIGALLITIPACKLYFSCQLNQRDNWIAANGNCQPNNKIYNHVLWHNVYLGLGIVQNKYGIIWKDSIGYNKAKQFKPSLYNVTQGYDDAIKGEFLTLLKNDWPFVLKAFIYKFLLALLMGFIFFNYGVFLIQKVKLNYRTFIPLLAGILFYMLPGILTYPIPHYLLGALNLLAISLLFLLNEVYSAKSNI
jgi:hypothetical protein